MDVHYLTVAGWGPAGVVLGCRCGWTAVSADGGLAPYDRHLLEVR